MLTKKFSALLALLISATTLISSTGYAESRQIDCQGTFDRAAITLLAANSSALAKATAAAEKDPSNANLAKEQNKYTAAVALLRWQLTPGARIAHAQNPSEYFCFENVVKQTVGAVTQLKPLGRSTLEVLILIGNPEAKGAGGELLDYVLAMPGLKGKLLVLEAVKGTEKFYRAHGFKEASAPLHEGDRSNYTAMEKQQ